MIEGGLGLCPVAGFTIGGTELSGFATVVSVIRNPLQNRHS